MDHPGLSTSKYPSDFTIKVLWIASESGYFLDLNLIFG